MITESGISAWLFSKIVPTLAALFGGLSLVLFWTPAKLAEKGKVASVFLAGALSATFGFAFAGAVAKLIGVDVSHLDYMIGLGWCLGFITTAVYNWAANAISKRAGHDILDVYQDVVEKVVIVKRKSE